MNEEEEKSPMDEMKPISMVGSIESIIKIWGIEAGMKPMR
jgi:hypothetical protein